MAQLNITELFKQTRLKLKLKWVAGLGGGNNQLSIGLRRNGLFAPFKSYRIATGDQ